MRYQELIAEWPHLAELRPWSPEFYREVRRLWLAKYPDVDQGTRDNLDMFVAIAEARERVA
jgi:hypothetical protein